ncbi:MAG: acyltransferase family protein [Rhodoferax sp.]|nr:acyltransferase family protein [Rhodoferax sp.]
MFRDPVLENQMGQFNIFGVILNQLARFGVPFFFTVSGYFWGLKIHGGMPEVLVAKQIFKRILLILVFWSLVYLLPYNMASMLQYGPLGPLKVWYWHVRELAANPLLLLFESTSQHLWFLIVLSLGRRDIDSIHLPACWKSPIAVATGLCLRNSCACLSKTPVGLEIGFVHTYRPLFWNDIFCNWIHDVWLVAT